MLQAKENLTTVLEELEWQNLNVPQWKHLSSIETLLKPIAHQTVVKSASIAFAMVVPLLKELKLPLKNVST